jgi:hypothetical protein
MMWPDTHRYSIKERIAVVFILLEDPDAFEDLCINRHSIVVPDGVLAQEVEDDEVRRLQRNVFTSQRTAADCIRFVLALLIARSEGKSVNEVHRGCPLAINHDLAAQICEVILANSIHV